MVLTFAAGYARISKMKNSKLFNHYRALARLKNCVLEHRLSGQGYTLYSNTTHTEGEFPNLNEVKDALDNDPSFK